MNIDENHSDEVTSTQLLSKHPSSQLIDITSNGAVSQKSTLEKIPMAAVQTKNLTTFKEASLLNNPVSDQHQKSSREE